MSSSKTETRNRILKTTWQLMEESQGQGVKMSDIAKASGISRQAVYLHFPSRTDLMIATMNYVDEEKGLNERLEQIKSAQNGIEVLEASVDVWGNYIPEIYGLAKALLSTRDTDEAAAAAWNNSMSCLLDACQATIATLAHEGFLASEWSQKEAVEMLYTLLSIQNWEQLTIECGWSQSEYTIRMKTISIRIFVDG